MYYLPRQHGPLEKRSIPGRETLTRHGGAEPPGGTGCVRMEGTPSGSFFAGWPASGDLIGPDGGSHPENQKAAYSHPEGMAAMLRPPSSSPLRDDGRQALCGFWRLLVMLSRLTTSPLASSTHTACMRSPRSISIVSVDVLLFMTPVVCHIRPDLALLPSHLMPVRRSSVRPSN